MPRDSIRRWLAEYKTLTEAEWNAYAIGIHQDNDLKQELADLFDGDLSPEIADPVCHQLFNFYRTSNTGLQRFTLDLVPTLICTYLTSLTSKDKGYSSTEACLLGIYNLETCGLDGNSNVKSINIPTLLRASIYHEPPSLASLVFSESSFIRYHSERATVIASEPLPPISAVNSQNRLQVLTCVVNRYNANISHLSMTSRLAFCKMCSRISKTGFTNICDDSMNMSSRAESVRAMKRGVSFLEEVRIPLSSAFLLELLSSIYYIMFNGQTKSAMAALEDIHFRASFDLFPDVLMVTNSIRNSLKCHLSRGENAMGISVAISPLLANNVFSKDAITNASFRAKKLPEDIDVQDFSSVTETQTNEEKSDGDVGLPSSSDVERPAQLQQKALAQQKANKMPTKSIMKKREEKMKEKVIRKESDSVLAGKLGFHTKETHELHPMKSPRHSTSSTSIMASTDLSSSTHRTTTESSVPRVDNGVSNEQTSDGQATSKTDISSSFLPNGDSLSTDNMSGSVAMPTASRSSNGIGSNTKKTRLSSADHEDDDEEFKNDVKMNTTQL